MELKWYCEKQKLRYKRLAELLGVTPSHVTQLINGKRRPSPELALKIEEVTQGAVTRMELLYPEDRIGGLDSIAGPDQ